MPSVSLWWFTFERLLVQYFNTPLFRNTGLHSTQPRNLSVLFSINNSAVVIFHRVNHAVVLSNRVTQAAYFLASSSSLPPYEYGCHQCRIFQYSLWISNLECAGTLRFHVRTIPFSMRCMNVLRLVSASAMLTIPAPIVAFRVP